MRLFSSFERCLFITVGLGVLVFAIADGDVALFFGALPVWAASWFITQGPKGKPLPRLMIGALVLAATAYTALTVLENLEEFVPAISRYLVWLLLIKLFDRVEPRDQAQLLVISLFLVVGACLTSNSLALGLSLLLYLPIFAWTAMLYQLHAGSARVERGLARLRPADRRRAHVKTGLSAIVWRDFVFTVSIAGFLSFFAAVIVFMITPRQSLSMAMGAWAAPSVGSEVGFSDEVQLGGEGLISESSTPVLDLRISNSDGDDLGPDMEHVYLRGAVLDSYVSGAWRRTISRRQRSSSEMAGFSGSPTMLGGERPLPENEIIQEYTYRSRKSGAIFAINRPVQIEFDRRLRFRLDPTTRYMESGASGRLEVIVWSSTELSNERSRRMPELFESGPIFEFGQQLIADAGLSRDPAVHHDPNDEAIALLFRDYLAENFLYDLNMTAPEVTEDPIEMFLFRTKVGHCEYFASAMAALCRSAGIDARVVTGYLASDYNADLGMYRVRASNAHAWTEVQVASGDWRTMDASPIQEVTVAQQTPGGLYGAMMRVWEAVEGVWLDAVVSFDEESREAAMGGAGVRFSDWLMSLGGETIRASLQGRRPRAVTAALRGVIAFSVALFIGIAVARLIRAWVRWRARRAEAQAMGVDAKTLREQMTLFRELEHALQRSGLGRPSWRPALRHAQSLSPHDSMLADDATRIVEMHYATRFGRRVISESQVSEGRALLDAIARRLRSGRRRSDEGDAAHDQG